MKRWLLVVACIFVVIICVFTFTRIIKEGGEKNNLMNLSEKSEEANYVVHENLTKNMNDGVDTKKENKEELIRWEYNMNDGGWKPSRDPPACPEALVFQTPTDIDMISSVLYPGQYRPDYKPHGGFRFDDVNSVEIPVYAPLEGYLLKGGRYYASGEIQYVFFILHPCGIMYRLGHLKKISPKLEALAEKLPEPKELDSRDYLMENIQIEKGELLATEVGVTDNYFFDWGVYDLRQKNDASKDPEWLKIHANDQAPYAICWLDFLSSEESVKIKSLPAADGNVGKQSDYC